MAVKPLKLLQHVDLVRGCEKVGGPIDIEVLSNSSYPVARFEAGGPQWRINPATDYERELLSSLVGQGFTRVIVSGAGEEATIEVIERAEEELTPAEAVLLEALLTARRIRDAFEAQTGSELSDDVRRLGITLYIQGTGPKGDNN